MAYVEFPRRRSQAAKAADCKSAIPGSNPGGASFPRKDLRLCPFLLVTRLNSVGIPQHGSGLFRVRCDVVRHRGRD